MNSLIFIFLMVFFGCAHNNDSPKTVVFPYAVDLLKKVQLRDSFQYNSTRRSPQIERELLKSPRRVYFRTLYNQYQILGQILHTKNEISFCPQFHHDKMEVELKEHSEMDFFRFSSVKDEGLDYFPESAFVTKSSISDYLRSIKMELETLCEEGVTDNYFKFDNLITHYAQKTSFHLDHRAMASVLKIPVFANFYLIKMISSSSLFFSPMEERDFIQLTRTFWFESYVAEASRMRGLFIKNQMVRR